PLVTNTNDSGPGSLRQAILDANNPANAGPSSIEFNIPASTASGDDVALPEYDNSTTQNVITGGGFDPSTQTWKIRLLSPLPTIAHQVTIDGYSQAQAPIPFVYPNEKTTDVQSI